MAEQRPLSVREAPQFEARWARTKVVLVVLLTLIVLAGLAGVFGRGPLSRAKAHALRAQALVTYERFAAVNTPGQISVEFNAPTGRPQASVTLDRSIIDHLRVNTTQPRSSSETTSAEGATFNFELGPDGRGKAVLSVEPNKPGLVHGAVTVNGERLPINLIIWP